MGSGLGHLDGARGEVDAPPVRVGLLVRGRGRGRGRVRPGPGPGPGARLREEGEDEGGERKLVLPQRVQAVERLYQLLFGRRHLGRVRARARVRFRIR